jgi:hypothetical protein
MLTTDGYCTITIPQDRYRELLEKERELDTQRTDSWTRRRTTPHTLEPPQRDLFESDPIIRRF